MIDFETIFDSDREEYEFMQENKEQPMKEQRAYTINMLGESLEKAKREVEEYKHNWQKIHDSYTADCLEHYNKGRRDATREIFEEIELWLAFDGDIRIITAEKFAELKKKHAESEHG